MRLERWVKVKLEHQASNLNSILRKGKQLNCHDLICGFQKGSGSHIKDDWEGTDQEGEEHRQGLAVSRWRQRPNGHNDTTYGGLFQSPHTFPPMT